MKDFSFLICQHESHADLYINGLPIGQIVGRKFVPHELTNPAGNRYEVEPSYIPGSPFKTMKEVREYLATTHQIFFEG